MKKPPFFSAPETAITRRRYRVAMSDRILAALLGLSLVLHQGSAQAQVAERDRETMRQVYRAAIEVPLSQFANLCELDFCADYGDRPASWRIGPFVPDKAMTFTKTHPMDDPIDIGWKCTILGNPTLIERVGALHMFYRAYPRKESQSTRIGQAVYTEKSGWVDRSGPPILYSTEPDEINSVENPKIHRAGDTYYLFYNAVWKPDPEFSAQVRQGYRDWGIFVVTKVATSKDLIHFERKGQVVPYSVSKGWSKSAVIPRSPEGEAVKINGKYLMFLSEGCGDKQFIGYSDDLLNWEFRQQTFLALPREMGRVVEVACCAANFEPTGQFFILDTFCMGRNQKYEAVQALVIGREYLDHPVVAREDQRRSEWMKDMFPRLLAISGCEKVFLWVSMDEFEGGFAPDALYGAATEGQKVRQVDLWGIIAGDRQWRKSAYLLQEMLNASGAEVRQDDPQGRHLVPTNWWDSAAAIARVHLGPQFPLDPDKAAPILDDLEARGVSAIEIFAPYHGGRSYAAWTPSTISTSTRPWAPWRISRRWCA